MAVVTASTLKTSMDTAATSLDTLIATPSVVNRDAALAAFTTVATNARDSRLIQSSDASSRRIHSDFERCAAGVKQELLNSSQHHQSAAEPVGPASIYRSIKRTYLGSHGPWVAYRQTATTD